MVVKGEELEKFIRNFKQLLTQLPGKGEYVANYITKFIRPKIFPLLTRAQIEDWETNILIYHLFPPILLDNSHNVLTMLKIIEDLNKPHMTPLQLKFWRFTRTFVEPLIGMESSLSSEMIEQFNAFFTDEILSELEQVKTPEKTGSYIPEVKVLKIPQFSLPNSRGETVSITDFKNKKNVIICIERSSPEYIKNFAENYEEFEENDVAIVPIIISGAEAAKYYEQHNAKDKFPVYHDEKFRVVDKLQLQEAIFGFQDDTFVNELDDYLEKFSRGGPVRLYIKEALALIVVDKAGIVQYAFYSNSNRRIKLEKDGRYSIRNIIFSNVWQDLLKVVQELKDYKPPRYFRLVGKVVDSGISSEEFKRAYEKHQTFWIKTDGSSRPSRTKIVPIPPQRTPRYAGPVKRSNRQTGGLIEQAKQAKNQGDNLKTIELCEKVLKIDAVNSDAWKLLEQIYKESNTKKVCGACRSYKLGICETRQQSIDFLNPTAKNCFYFLLKPSFG